MMTGELVPVIGRVIRVQDVDYPNRIVVIDGLDGRILMTKGQGTFYQQAKVGDLVDTVGYIDARGDLIRVKFNKRGEAK